MFASSSQGLKRLVRCEERLFLKALQAPCTFLLTTHNLFSMFTFTRTFRLEKYLGKSYSYESMTIGAEADTLEEAKKEVYEEAKKHVDELKNNKMLDIFEQTIQSAKKARKKKV